jgi:hypothetical protein
MKFRCVLAVVFCLLTTTAGAAVTCNESITAVVNHSGGNVYFTTDQSCASNWCQLSGNADFIKRGYAMLLAAQLTGKKVAFQWGAIASCASNPIFSSPEYMWM